MSERPNHAVFEVKFAKTNAELEITGSLVKCISGNVVHFETSREDLRTVDQTHPSKILLVFYQDGKPVQCEITSKYCSSIVKSLTSQI